MSKYFTLYAVKHNTSTFNGIKDHSVNPNVEAALARNSGTQRPTHGGVVMHAPILSFSSVHIAEALGICGEAGLAIAGAGAQLAFRRRGQLVPSSSNDNVTITAAKGIIVPRQIVAQPPEAVISYDILPIGDASNAPLVYSAAATLSLTPNTTERFTVGPVKLNGVAIEVQSWTYTFGWREVLAGNDGLAYNTVVGLGDQEPQLEIVTRDLAALATYGPNGTAIVYDGVSDFGVEFYLRKMGQGVARVANATEEHIHFMLSRGTIHPGDASDSANSDGATATLIVRPEHDGTNALLQVDTTAAIA